MTWGIGPLESRHPITTKLPPALATLAPESTAQERRAGNFMNVRENWPPVMMASKNRKGVRPC